MVIGFSFTASCPLHSMSSLMNYHSKTEWHQNRVPMHAEKLFVLICINELNCMFQVTSLILWPHWTSHHLQYGRVGEGLVTKKAKCLERNRQCFVQPTTCMYDEPLVMKNRCYILPNAQDALQPILISCTWTIGRWGLLSHARKVVRWLTESGNAVMRILLHGFSTIFLGCHKGYLQ